MVSIQSFAKKLAEKINFYDSVSKNKFSGISMINPFMKDFYKPINLTVIWVDDNDKED